MNKLKLRSASLFIVMKKSDEFCRGIVDEPVELVLTKLDIRFIVYYTNMDLFAMYGSRRASSYLVSDNSIREFKEVCVNSLI